MSSIESPTRYGCIIGGRQVSWAKLGRSYVCNGCGGRIAHRFQFNQETGETEDSAACGDCGGGDFVTETTYYQQITDAKEVMDGLPPHLAALLKGETERWQSRTDPIADLFD